MEELVIMDIQIIQTYIGLLWISIFSLMVFHHLWTCSLSLSFTSHPQALILLKTSLAWSLGSDIHWSSQGGMGKELQEWCWRMWWPFNTADIIGKSLHSSWEYTHHISDFVNSEILWFGFGWPDCWHRQGVSFRSTHPICLQSDCLLEHCVSWHCKGTSGSYGLGLSFNSK